VRYGLLLDALIGDDGLIAFSGFVLGCSNSKRSFKELAGLLA
jgi:hypothetical protein